MTQGNTPCLTLCIFQQLVPTMTIASLVHSIWHTVTAASGSLAITDLNTRLWHCMPRSSIPAARDGRNHCPQMCLSSTLFDSAISDSALTHCILDQCTDTSCTVTAILHCALQCISLAYLTSAQPLCTLSQCTSQHNSQCTTVHPTVRLTVHFTAHFTVHYTAHFTVHITLHIIHVCNIVYQYA